MKKYDSIANEFSNIHRFELRNLPNSCLYCAYRLRPSCINTPCSVYCRNAFKSDCDK